MTQIRLEPAEPLAPTALVGLLAPALRVEEGRRTRTRVTYLDTFDWRLHEAGMSLTREREEGHESWRLRPRADAPAQVAPVDRPARFASDLPAGWLRDSVEPVTGVRALLPVGEVVVKRRLLRVVDGEGNTTVRVWWEEVATRGGDRRDPRPPTTLVRLEATAAGEPALAVALDLLGTRGGARPAPLDDLAAAAGARGRRPGDYSSKPRLALAPGDPADRALRAILGELLAGVRANVAGVVGDLDSEFLHDLRVAVRRTRSALAQLEGVLPPESTEPLVEGLRWLGAATGPVRDLDVFLLDLDAARAVLRPAAGAALEPLVEEVRRERAQAHAALVKALRCRRFSALVSLWSAVAIGGGPRSASTAIREVADDRVRRAYRTVVKRGRRLGESPPPEPLHRVRIAAKKLRYLLELFRSLFPDQAVDAFVRHLKRLQDLLGGVQDTVVQLGRLDALAARLHAAGRVQAGALLAAGRLVARVEARQDELRAGFTERFAEFAGPETEVELERLLAREEREPTCA